MLQIHFRKIIRKKKIKPITYCARRIKANCFCAKINSWGDLDAIPRAGGRHLPYSQASQN